MKPKNDIERKAFDIANSLNVISDKEKELIIINSIEHKAFRNKKGTICLECGHAFKTDKKKCTCPSCGLKLKVEDRRTYKEKNYSFTHKLVVKDNYQIVITIVCIQSYYKGIQAEYTVSPIIIHFINSKSTILLTKDTYRFSYYIRLAYKIDSDFSIKQNSNRTYYYPDYVLNKKQILPILKRNGFKGGLHRFDTVSLFEELLRDNKSETLFKIGMHKALAYGIYKTKRIYDYWKQLMIMNKYKYVPYDFSIWYDYIKLLEYFKMDLYNPNNICPKNLKEEHDRLLSKKVELNKLELAITEKEKHIKSLKVLTQKRKIYKNKIIENGDFLIKPLLTIKEYKEEAVAMNNCVYKNKYFGFEDTLVLSAMLNGIKIETVEVNIDTKRVIQCYGYDNEETDYHDQIIEIVEHNINKIIA